MKRSQINREIETAIGFFGQMGFHLPAWAHWSPEDWKRAGLDYSEIQRNQLGWDLTDFGSGEYFKRGLLLFTIRNGNPGYDRKNYCEKIMIVGENQETPRHYHYRKMEDIINRGGGNLMIELFSDEILGSIPVRIDGMLHRFDEGEAFSLKPGQSICLEPGLYHRFWGEEGKGPVLVGEVSAVNDDQGDNHFFEALGRFPEIEEDESPRYLLIGDYARYIA